VGDFIVTLPVLAALRNQFPQTRLEVLAYPQVATLAVRAGLADAAHLRMKVRALPTCIAEDLDCSGVVDSADVSLILLSMGPCDGCPEDLDASGLVDSADVALALLAF